MIFLLTADPPPDGSGTPLIVLAASAAGAFVVGAVRAWWNKRKDDTVHALPAHAPALDATALGAAFRTLIAQHVGPLSEDKIDALRSFVRHAPAIRRLLLGDDSLTRDDSLNARLGAMEAALAEIRTYVAERRKAAEIERAVSDRLAGRTTNPGGDY